ncbi:MAG: hypothetical protein JSS29_10805 [Proteobacteria bacterium]|nr:hypothetical protein [Pseudomonadota bacterium]
MLRPLCLGLLAAFALSTRAHALGRMADVTLIDRDTGAVLTPVYARGEYWVAGRPGARYAIHIRNSSGYRLLAVTSVDGVNVLSGATAGYDQQGYIFGSAQEYDITGWRKSTEEVAAFTFTAASSSYAGRTGRAANIGVIGVALFRERYVPPVLIEPAPAASDAPRDAASPAARAASKSALAESLGTGHGARETSVVSFANFVREQETPNEIVRIRYDSLENLVALGIIRRPPWPRGPHPDAFPGSPANFVPDPPG